MKFDCARVVVTAAELVFVVVAAKNPDVCSAKHQLMGEAVHGGIVMAARNIAHNLAADYSPTERMVVLE
jgi:hypothetical protein